MEEYHVNTLSWQICLLQMLVHQLPAVLQPECIREHEGELTVVGSEYMVPNEW